MGCDHGNKVKEVPKIIDKIKLTFFLSNAKEYYLEADENKSLKIAIDKLFENPELNKDYEYDYTLIDGEDINVNLTIKELNITKYTVLNVIVKKKQKNTNSNLINLNDSPNQKNEIIIKILVTEENVFKEINILGKFFDYDTYKMQDYKEINEDNCELYINNVKNEFKNDLIFNEEGEYVIKFLLKEKIESMAYIFHNCELITSIDLTNFDSSNLTNCNGAFFYNISLEEIKGLNKLNTKNVEDFSNMFNCCKKLSGVLDVSNFDFSNATNMESMFNGCFLLDKIKMNGYVPKNCKIDKIFNQIEDIKEKVEIVGGDFSIRLQEYLKVDESFEKRKRRMIEEACKLSGIPVDDFI